LSKGSATVILDLAGYLYFAAVTHTLPLFDQPLCLFEYACGLFPKDIDSCGHARMTSGLLTIDLRQKLLARK